ncbi:MAG: heme lyase NrfEFG subunit NrfE [Paracoccus denitrificans]|nr:MAG: heme lyase NrfEFG subunit NrfE [Paracoccus denitrificans]PZO84160.1 MAG: heme lyase NrfEFG subunit NrfE [Paracoccus denitrificans]
MIAETGHFALILALGVALFQVCVPMAGAVRGNVRWMEAGRAAAVLQLILLFWSFAALTFSFVTSDFSVALVYENSHSAKPLLYKFSGVWGNHEGSMLLWVLILALFGAAVAGLGQTLPPTLRARVLSVQGAIGAAFLSFILLTSNPFLRIGNPPLNGRDLNPLLQDPGLAFHPPFLYLGYVGLSVSFSFAVAALLEGRIDAAWARWVRPWTLAAWVFLTIGIALGSWWAYYELGWGGFWFWDPVENASFMPWLLAGALLHSAIVVEKREALKSWTILLAILAFGFSLIGTFIVRSGVITSVHSFASDPERGLYILVLLAVFIGGALTLYAARADRMTAKGVFQPVSREGALVLNNLLLAVSAFVVFVGTIWPLVAEYLWDRRLSVGPPFFNTAFTPFAVAIAIALPIGSILPWKRGRLGRVVTQLRPALIFAVAVAAVVFAVSTGRSGLAVVGASLGAWLIGGAAVDLWQRAGHTASRLTRLPLADWGRATSHAGVGVTFIGISLLTAWQQEDVRVAKIGDGFDIGAYQVTLRNVQEQAGPNYRALVATMTVARGDREVATLRPEKRIYPVQGVPTTEAAISTGIFGDIYLVIGDPQPGGGWAIRAYVKPFALWIWAGFGLMAFGGALSLSDRRWRVAPAAKRQPRAVPAE